MFKIFILLLALACAESTNETAQLTISDITTEAVVATPELIEAIVQVNATSPVPPAIVNFVQLSNTVIDTQNMSENSRMIKSGSNVGIPVHFVVIIVSMLSVVVIGILTALFVMRRRFSIWRLNVKSEESGVEAVDGKVDKVEKSEEKEANMSASGITTVENKQALFDNAVCVAVDNGHLNEASVDINKQEVQTSEENKQQASPSSSSPLIDNNDESAKLINEEKSLSTESSHQEPVTTISSSSLIVNVLNELSESVASKLASKSPSASKLASKQTDPEKPLLNDQ